MPSAVLTRQEVVRISSKPYHQVGLTFGSLHPTLNLLAAGIVTCSTAMFRPCGIARVSLLSFSLSPLCPWPSQPCLPSVWWCLCKMSLFAFRKLQTPNPFRFVHVCTVYCRLFPPQQVGSSCLVPPPAWAVSWTSRHPMAAPPRGEHKRPPKTGI